MPSRARTASFLELMALIFRSSRSPLRLTVSRSSTSSIKIFSPKFILSVKDSSRLSSLRYNTTKRNCPVTHTVWLLTLTSSKITEPLVCIMFNRSGLLSFTIQSSSSVIWVNALLLSKFCLNSCLFNSKTKKSPLFEVSILILIQRKGILFIPNKVSFECPL